MNTRQLVLLALLFAVVLKGGRFAWAQPKPTSPSASWKLGSKWVLNVERFPREGEDEVPVSSYKLNAWISGQDESGGVPCWRLTMHSWPTAGEKVFDHYSVSIGKEDGKPRRIQHTVLKNNRANKPRLLDSWLEDCQDLTLISGAPPGFPLEFFPMFESRELKGARPGTSWVLKKREEDGKIILEVALHNKGAEELLIRQHWIAGEPWWREYERFVKGKKDLQARVDAPPLVAGAGPQPKPRPAPPDQLHTDKALRVSFNLDKEQPDLAHILEKLRAVTGLEMELAPDLANHQPDFGVIQPSPKGWHAFTIMRIVAGKQLENGRWEKTDKGYRLVGKSLALRQVAAAPDATPARGTPWLLVGIGVILGVVLLSLGGLLIVRRGQVKKELPETKHVKIASPGKGAAKRSSY